MPEPRVVDTDVASYLFKRDTPAQIFRPYLLNSIPLPSFMTVAELQHWALHRYWGTRQRQELEDFVGQCTIVFVDRPMCQRWAKVVDRARRRGRPIQVADAWIAATAISLGVPLLSHNRDDFLGVDTLRLL